MPTISDGVCTMGGVEYDGSAVPGCNFNWKDATAEFRLPHESSKHNKNQSNQKEFMKFFLAQILRKLCGQLAN